MNDIGLINLALFLVIGLVAGWIASSLLRGRGLGLVGNLIVGVIGAYVGPVVLRFLASMPAA